MKLPGFSGLQEACDRFGAQFAEAVAPLQEACVRVARAAEAASASFREYISRVDWTALGESMRKQRAARADPDNPKSKPWIETGWMTPRERAPIEPYLPDPTKHPGRPPGRGRIATDEGPLEEMDRLMAAGMSRYAAARQLRPSKGSAGHLVRLHKARSH